MYSTQRAPLSMDFVVKLIWVIAGVFSYLPHESTKVTHLVIWQMIENRRLLWAVYVGLSVNEM